MACLSYLLRGVRRQTINAYMIALSSFSNEFNMMLFFPEDFLIRIKRMGRSISYLCKRLRPSINEIKTWRQNNG
jgi:hypothetical protein